ncbi:MAG: SDR family oxidoreductase [Methanophagales archaeon]|nr:SDR family oxidoreductase [Methanophagales archaeon]
MDGIIKQGIEEIKREFDTEVAEGKNILVTGGAGFLGSWICDVLVESKANVICLDNFSSGLKENISHLLGRKNFKFVQHDITQPIFFNEEIDIVMHLASRASPFEFEKYPIQILKANTLGIWVALGIAKKHEAKFLYTSTSEIYGDAKEIPTTEEYRGNVNPIGPRSCYDEAKRCGESYVIAYRMQHGLDTRIARIFNTYGPRMRAEGIYGRVVPRFVEQALSNKPITIFGDGTQTRSFCYVTDQVEGLLKLAFSERAEGEVVNIGNDREITILELAKLIKELTKSSSEIEFHPLPKDDPMRRKPDISKAKKLLGWKPEVELEEGLRMMIEWFKEKER